MADRTSARIFGSMFKILAENPSEDHKEVARVLHRLAQDCDFTYEQMDADEACIALGIAYRGIDPRYPEDGETVIFEIREAEAS